MTRLMTAEQVEAHNKRVKNATPPATLSPAPSKEDVGPVAAAPNKFNARKTSVDGIEFDSKHESEVYQLLRLQEKEGSIMNLQTHVPIQVSINNQHVFTYECDFVYLLDRNRKIFADAKGYRKGSAYQLFRLKKAVIKAVLGVEIEEV